MDIKIASIVPSCHPKLCMLPRTQRSVQAMEVAAVAATMKERVACGEEISMRIVGVCSEQTDCGCMEWTRGLGRGGAYEAVDLNEASDPD
jgi:hypothetical protein